MITNMTPIILDAIYSIYARTQGAGVPNARISLPYQLEVGSVAAKRVTAVASPTNNQNTVTA